jgi:predicted ABC-class ATPase
MNTMHDSMELERVIRRIDNRGYKAYQEIRGEYRFEFFTLSIDHVQADPFAAPSRVRIKVPLSAAGFPAELSRGRGREIAFCDYLARCFHIVASSGAGGRAGSGKSGLIGIERPGQEILERTSVVIRDQQIEARIVVGLPAFGRRIAGEQAMEIFFSRLPALVEQAFHAPQIDLGALALHVQVKEDADHLRDLLEKNDLVAFVANGAILPRRSGVDERPMTGGPLVPFSSPPSLEVVFDLPHLGTITGMGVKKGITLIVGGGFHGKSTLLSAIEQGIYDHIPGDGREYVVSTRGSVKIRAEDGRNVQNVDISPFISNLPFGRDTRAFSTADASGSTSQAASIVESLEMGADLLLIDEDTSATNFMIRDHRMQELVAKDREPITPFIDRARTLFARYGTSAILVVGGSGDYFDIADTVICMHEYIPEDCSARALEISHASASRRTREAGPMEDFRRRAPLPESFDARKGRSEEKVSARGINTILFGVTPVDLGAVEQLVDTSQTTAIGRGMVYATRYMDGSRSLTEVIGRVCDDIREHGLDILAPYPRGDMAGFRGFELAAAINRLRTVTMRQVM